MANDIKRKDLYQQLSKIKANQWLKVAEDAHLRICRGSKHPDTIRDPSMSENDGRASLITVIPNNLHKIINQSIFKHLRQFGIEEDKIWKSLGLLK